MLLFSVTLFVRDAQLVHLRCMSGCFLQAVGAEPVEYLQLAHMTGLLGLGMPAPPLLVPQGAECAIANVDHSAQASSPSLLPANTPSTMPASLLCACVLASVLLQLRQNAWRQVMTCFCLRGR